MNKKFYGGNEMKKLIALLLAAMMVFALCACGASEEPAAEEQPAAEAPAEEATEAPAEEEAPVIKVGIAAPDVTHGWVAGVPRGRASAHPGGYRHRQPLEQADSRHDR